MHSYETLRRQLERTERKLSAKHQQVEVYSTVIDFLCILILLITLLAAYAITHP